MVYCSCFGQWELGVESRSLLCRIGICSWSLLCKGVEWGGSTRGGVASFISLASVNSCLPPPSGTLPLPWATSCKASVRMQAWGEFHSTLLDTSSQDSSSLCLRAHFGTKTMLWGREGTVGVRYLNRRRPMGGGGGLRDRPQGAVWKLRVAALARPRACDTENPRAQMFPHALELAREWLVDLVLSDLSVSFAA